MLDFLKLSTAIQDVGRQASSLRKKIERLKRQRESLETAALPRSEFADMLCEMVDASGERFLLNLNASVRHMYHKPNIDIQGRHINVLTATGAGGGHQLHQENLLWVFRDQIKDALRKAVDLLPDYPDEVGPPKAERPALIKKLDKEIANLERQDAELRQQAEAAGIQIGRIKPPERQEKYAGGIPGNREAAKAKP
ncbi:MAG TPA: hypothetical protein ENI80_00895 [Acidiferrobacteraceae bacterium]|nr:hypothetical protein [Acidiferrobacteraceae bacterium]